MRAGFSPLPKAATCFKYQAASIKQEPSHSIRSLHFSSCGTSLAGLFPLRGQAPLPPDSASKQPGSTLWSPDSDRASVGSMPIIRRSRVGFTQRR